MLMKHKPSQYLAIPHALLKSLFCVWVCVCVCVCVLCVKADSGAPGMGAALCSPTGPTQADARSCYTWHWPKQKGGAVA